MHQSDTLLDYSDGEDFPAIAGGTPPDGHSSVSSASPDLQLVELKEQLAQVTRKIEHLTAALESSRRIGCAIGILMSRHHYTSDEAFQRIVVASNAMHRKVRELAEDIILVGDLEHTDPA